MGGESGTGELPIGPATRPVPFQPMPFQPHPEHRGGAGPDTPANSDGPMDRTMHIPRPRDLVDPDLLRRGPGRGRPGGIGPAFRAPERLGLEHFGLDRLGPGEDIISSDRRPPRGRTGSIPRGLRPGRRGPLDPGGPSGASRRFPVAATPVPRRAEPNDALPTRLPHPADPPHTGSPISHPYSTNPADLDDHLNQLDLPNLPNLLDAPDLPEAPDLRDLPYTPDSLDTHYALDAPAVPNFADPMDLMNPEHLGSDLLDQPEAIFEADPADQFTLGTPGRGTAIHDSDVPGPDHIRAPATGIPVTDPARLGLPATVFTDPAFSAADLAAATQAALNDHALEDQARDALAAEAAAAADGTGMPGVADFAPGVLPSGLPRRISGAGLSELPELPELSELSGLPGLADLESSALPRSFLTSTRPDPRRWYTICEPGQYTAGVRPSPVHGSTGQNGVVVPATPPPGRVTNSRSGPRYATRCPYEYEAAAARADLAEQRSVRVATTVTIAVIIVALGMLGLMTVGTTL